MGYESKQAYKQFLKSYAWQKIRFNALKRYECRCIICLSESVFNDVHHIYYLKNWRLTKQHHVVVLCRECHSHVHSHHLMQSNQPDKPADSFRRWIIIRDELRLKHPEALEKIKSNKLLCLPANTLNLRQKRREIRRFQKRS